MFEECLDVFTEMLKNEDNLNLKGYIPANGSYIIVKQDGTADSWVPSSSDVFAEDWNIAPTSI